MRLIRLDKAEPGGTLGNFNDRLNWFFGPPDEDGLLQVGDREALAETLRSEVKKPATEIKRLKKQLKVFQFLVSHGILFIPFLLRPTFLVATSQDVGGLFFSCCW